MDFTGYRYNAPTSPILIGIFDLARSTAGVASADMPNLDAGDHGAQIRFVLPLRVVIATVDPEDVGVCA
jgi:hypothetical protein